MEYKISKDMAEAEFERFSEAMDLDLESADEDAEDKKAAAQVKNKIINALQKGSLVIDDKGQPVYTPQRSECEPLTFYESTGASLMAMDKAGDKEKTKKLFLVGADITKTSVKTFSMLKGGDLKTCLAITSAFLLG